MEEIIGRNESKEIIEWNDMQVAEIPIMSSEDGFEVLFMVEEIEAV